MRGESMRIESIGGLRVRITGGTDGHGGGEGVAVVLLHGFGAGGSDLVPLASVLASAQRIEPACRFYFPEAPLELPWGADSRAWWHIDMERLERAIMTGESRDLTRDVPDGLPRARELVMSMLAELEARHAAPLGSIVLGGFSQGAMLACDVGLHASRNPAGLALMSATLLAETEWLPLMPGRAGTPVLLSHGKQDPLLPFSIAERLRDELKRAGLSVQWVPFRGAHEIPHDVLVALDELIASALTS